MPLPLDRQNALPVSFPVGARYVVEGQGGKDGRLRVVSRYVVLPGGQRIDVSSSDAVAAMPASVPVRQRGRKSALTSSAKKNSSRRGTTRQESH